MLITALSLLSVATALSVGYYVITHDNSEDKTCEPLLRSKLSKDTPDNPIFLSEQLGSKGEAIVKGHLDKLPPKYTCYHNVYVPKGNDQYAQIDHMIVSVHGIHVIETKHYAGDIYQEGAEKPNHWYRISSKGERLEFIDPILQNAQHITALKEHFAVYVPDSYFHSIIVFSGSGTLHGIKSDVPVCHADELVDTLLSYEKKILPPKLSDGINKRIKSIKVPDNVAEIHKKNIRRSHIPMGTCPLCHKTLVLRRGGHGSFIGCMGFPNCRYTKNCTKK